jgi:hypothetical protein
MSVGYAPALAHLSLQHYLGAVGGGGGGGTANGTAGIVLLKGTVSRDGFGFR